ncbi:hypothetical protein IWQ56_001761 [Coemansia nantahalensis]|nr:hypothetical protein IWQ56_001761 [Coemansia nantahalensis]
MHASSAETVKVLVMYLWEFSGDPNVEVRSAATWVAAAKMPRETWALEVPDHFQLFAFMGKLTGAALKVAREARPTSTEQLFATLVDAFPQRFHQNSLTLRVASGDAFCGFTRMNAVARLEEMAHELHDQRESLAMLARATRSMFEGPWANIGVNPDTITKEGLDLVLSKLKAELARDERIKPELFGLATSQMQATAPRPTPQKVACHVATSTPAAADSQTRSQRKMISLKARVKMLEAEIAALRRQLEQQQL